VGTVGDENCGEAISPFGEAGRSRARWGSGYICKYRGR